MTCTRVSHGIICCAAPAFEFRFLAWKCEFTDGMMGGPYWTISVPYLSFKDFWYTAKIWRDPWDWKFYTGMTEIYFAPGEYNPLWWIFNYKYNKWRDKQTLSAAEIAFRGFSKNDGINLFPDKEKENVSK